jgi:hypothetical protein
VIDMQNCANCNHLFEGKFCPECGERVLNEKDFSIPKFLEQSFDMFTHFDGKIFGSIRSLIAKPGQLTLDNWRGKRVQYAKPFQLFIVLNAVFYLLNYYTVQFNIFNTPLINHVKFFSYSNYAQQVVDAKLISLNIDYATFEKSFNMKADGFSKSLILVMIPLFALISYFLTWRWNKNFVKHLIFATHFYSFVLLFCCTIIMGSFLLFTLKNLGLNIQLQEVLVDGVFSTFSLLCAVYFLARSVITLYKPKWYATAFLVSAFVFGFYYCLVAYRFLLFVLVSNLV